MKTILNNESIQPSSNNKSIGVNVNKNIDRREDMLNIDFTKEKDNEEPNK